MFFTQKRVTVKEVQLSRKSLDSSDVYILDLGLEIFQWNGKTCNKDEKFKAVQYLQTLKVCVSHCINDTLGPLHRAAPCILCT